MVELTFKKLGDVLSVKTDIPTFEIEVGKVHFPVNLLDVIIGSAGEIINIGDSELNIFVHYPDIKIRFPEKKEDQEKDRENIDRLIDLTRNLYPCFKGYGEIDGKITLDSDFCSVHFNLPKYQQKIIDYVKIDELNFEKSINNKTVNVFIYGMEEDHEYFNYFDEENHQELKEVVDEYSNVAEKIFATYGY